MVDPTALRELFAGKRRALPAFVYKNGHASSANGGLFFERIGADWVMVPATRDRPERLDAPKKEWAAAIAGTKGNPVVLSDYSSRLARLADVHGGEVRPFRTDWRLVTGTGIPNPMENGLTWHRTLAVPYLPGSSVKGLVKAFAMEWAEDAPDPDVLDPIFGLGPERDDQSSSGETAGSLVFFDAVPVAPVHVVADVMTPHQGKYYQGDNPSPDDRYPPVPIIFLAVADATFQFAIAPAHRFTNRLPRAGEPDRTETATTDLALGMRWLEAALHTLGAGAKTAANYGRMSPVSFTRS